MMKLVCGLIAGAGVAIISGTLVGQIHKPEMRPTDYQRIGCARRVRLQKPLRDMPFCRKLGKEGWPRTQRTREAAEICRWRAERQSESREAD